MDDSDQDFVDLCSKLLKRVRKKPGEPRQVRKAEHQPLSQANNGDKCIRKSKKEGDSGAMCAETQPVCNGAEAEQNLVSGGDGSGDAGASVIPAAASGHQKDPRAKDKVLLKMQKFKRLDPLKLLSQSQPTMQEMDINPAPPPTQRQEAEPVCNGAEAEQHLVSGGDGSGDAGASVIPAAASGHQKDLRAKDKVLLKMQKFKRADPQKMVHKSQPTAQEININPAPPPTRRQDTPQPSGLQPELEDSDEALALRLQQELDREAAAPHIVDLEDGGLFFCQICHRDLSLMSPNGRAHHLNRCLDESERSAPTLLPPPPPAPGVPDCPICGKKFKSQKSRSAHLKRCSSDMGVSPAVLLQAVQRQAVENQNVTPATTLPQNGGTKRKGPSKPGLPAKKKQKKKTEALDENMMVALALSSSLLEQEKEQLREMQLERELERVTAVSDTATTPGLKWKQDAVKGRGKRKKGAAPRPLLLLVQDPNTALLRLQERVSALLLRSRPPSPLTPTRCPSSLPGISIAAPLWQKSKLLGRCSICVSDFYTPELAEFITPWESAVTDAASSGTQNKPDSLVHPATEGTPLTAVRAYVPPSSSQTASPAPSTPGTGQLPVGSQTLRDLMELAEDGMTLTQCGYTNLGPDKDKSAVHTTQLCVSGFILEQSEALPDLGVSGSLREETRSEDANKLTRGTANHPGVDQDQSGALSRLASNLSSMVNNPQLSDVQLQVDSGDVFFAHSFMMYARCPLLAEMVHESGFGVQEEGMPAALRVLISDVPGQAVSALLRYIYTANCSIPASLRPHVLELASRFDLPELQQLCELQLDEAASRGIEEDYMYQEESINNQTDEALMELLRSMWNEEDEEEDGTDTNGGGNEKGRVEGEREVEDLTAGDVDNCEEKVNEQELEEIYEFAATQRRREDEKDSAEEVEEEEKVDEEEDGEEVFTKLTEPRRSCKDFSIKNSQSKPDHSLDRSYNRLFSDSWGVYDEGDPLSSPSTSAPAKKNTPHFQQPPTAHKLASEMSGRTLLQSSVSLIDEVSLSNPNRSTNLPFPGLSPGMEGDRGRDASELGVPDENSPLKRESQGPQSIFDPPHMSQKKKEPELIVLSDSSEEMKEVLGSRSPSPLLVEDPHISHTQIKPKSILKATEPSPQNKKFSSFEFSPDDRPSSPVDCSPEVSWLIPSTPFQPGLRTSSSSSQTRSSMCRTKLFPRRDACSSSVFSSPALLQTSSSPNKVSAHEGSIPRMKLEEMDPTSSSPDLHLCTNRSSFCDAINEEVFAVPLSQSKLSRSSKKASSKPGTPSHPQSHSYSSTPLHTELHLPAALLTTSPLHSNLDKQSLSSERSPRASGSLDNTALGSFHLSPLSDHSDPSSSSSRRGFESSQRERKSSQHSVRSSCHYRAEPGVRNEEGDGAIECNSKGILDEAEQEHAKEESIERESSFQQSFTGMDEPPIAFNDSWGLDACAEVNPGCFSLRLEDSKDSSLQDQSLRAPETAKSPSSTDHQSPAFQHSKSDHNVSDSSPNKAHSVQPPEMNSLLDSKIWGSWEEDEEEECLPLSQRMKPSAQLKTPANSHKKRRRTMVPITPMPHFSDMDTPDLKNKLNRFGVRPLPKRQMILKLKEIHQYTHQLESSDSDFEASPASQRVQVKPPPKGSAVAGDRPASSTQTVRFKEPRAPADISPLKQNREEAELLSASQGSNTSSTAEESERSNPELFVSSEGDSDSDGGISASQVASRLQERLKAVRSFILSDSSLYTQILQFQPLVLSQLQEKLKAAGIRLGAAKLVDYLDSQCITFTTAKPGQSAPGRRRGKRKKAAGDGRAGRKRVARAAL